MKPPAICRDIGMHRRHQSEVIALESSLGSSAISLDMERQGTQNPKTIESFFKDLDKKVAGLKGFEPLAVRLRVERST